jgi:hypothetical protein
MLKLTQRLYRAKLTGRVNARAQKDVNLRLKNTAGLYYNVIHEQAG